MVSGMESSLVLPVPIADDPASGESRGGTASSRVSERFPTAEIVVAAVAFVAFCVVVLTKATTLLEPDDSAYLASIVALTHGHLALTSAQYHQVAAELQAHYGTNVLQWDHLSSGQWISEKNPGYPFYALPFQWLGILRAAPLFAGAVASISLFIGGRRWLGRWGGTWAVILFLCSGAAMAFAWRPTMPSFSDAAFVAAGAGALLWTMLATDASARRRTLAGLAGFVFLEIAVAMRYTDIALLAVAVLAVAVMARRCRLPLRSLSWWAGSLVVVGVAVGLFNAHFYGGVTKTGYGAGVITFSSSAIIPNLRIMPKLVVQAIPGLVLGGAALVWIAVRAVRSRSDAIEPETSRQWRIDAVVGAWLGLGWLAIWGLYSAYTWTAQMGGGHGPGGPGGLHLPAGVHLPAGLHLPTGLHLPGGGMPDGGQGIHLIRFYLPALGLIALLGAWLLVQIPKWLPPIVLGVLCVLGVLSFYNLTAGHGLGQGGFGNGPLPAGAAGQVPFGGSQSGGMPAGGMPPDGNGGPGGFPSRSGGAPPAGFGPPPIGARPPGVRSQGAPPFSGPPPGQGVRQGK